MKTYERPDVQNQNDLTQKIFKSVADSKEKLMTILNQPKVGQDITEDSKERKLRSRRRVVNPNSVLEKDYIKNSQLPRAKKVESAAPTPASEIGDPNL